MALSATAALAAPRPVTVYLERNGRLVQNDGDETVIPKFGGGDTAWRGIVGCVKEQFSPFQIDVVDTRPSRGDFITAVIGGRASQLGLNDRTTNGVGPYSPDRVLRSAIVHIFSRVGTGERDVKNLCAVTVHEVSHSLGLDHTFKCGDTMSYFLDRCGPRRLLDVDMPCGEDGPRQCGDGEESQNSYRKLAAAVGLRVAERRQPQPEPEREDRDSRDDDGWDDGSDPWGDEPEPQIRQPRRPQPQQRRPQPQQQKRPQPQPRRPIGPAPNPNQSRDDDDDDDDHSSCGGHDANYTVEPVYHRGRRYYVIRRSR